MMRRKLWYPGIVHVLMPLCLFWCLLRDTLFWVIYIINRRMLFSVYLLNDIQFDLSMICCRLNKIVTKIVFSVYLLIVSPSIMIHQYFNFSRSILLVFCFVFCIRKGNSCKLFITYEIGMQAIFRSNIQIADWWHPLLQVWFVMMLLGD